MNETNFLNMTAVSLYQGEVSDLRAEIFLQLNLPLSPEWTVTAKIKGPRCNFSNTLPFTIDFHEVAHENLDRLLQAVVPDPCFWTPQLPMLYDVIVETRSADDDISKFSLPLGIKSFVATGPNLYQQKRRVVLRGGYRQSLDQSQWPTWRETSTTLCVTNLGDPYQQASEEGLGMIVRLENSNDYEMIGMIHNLIRHPAVLMIIAPGQTNLPKIMSSYQRNKVLWAQMLTTNEIDKTNIWADVLVCDSSEIGQIHSQIEKLKKPVVIVDRTEIESPFGANETRSHCDQLQKAMSQHGDFAGYLVGFA